MNYRFSQENHKILSTTWEKLAQVDCSKATQIARTRKACKIKSRRRNLTFSLQF